jgi:2-iminobutanoate/2-iminopropanoate deaminase
MALQKIISDSAPKPIGPYSQAVLVDGKFLYVSGTVPIVPSTGMVVEGDIKAQARQVLKNLEQVLKAGGATFGNVFKTTFFLKDMNEFSAMNEVYSEFLGVAVPARSTVEVARLPRDVRIEIEAIALIER